MPNYQYCVCGGKTIQGLEPVKFCASCGQPLNQIKAVVNPSKPSPIFKPKFKSIPKKEEITEEDDNEENYELDDEGGDNDNNDHLEISNFTENPIELDLESLKPKRVKIGSIAGTVEKVQPLNKMGARNQESLKQSKKQFLSELKKEGGSIRPK